MDTGTHGPWLTTYSKSPVVLDSETVVELVMA